MTLLHDTRVFSYVILFFSAGAIILAQDSTLKPQRETGRTRAAIFTVVAHVPSVSCNNSLDPKPYATALGDGGGAAPSEAPRLRRAQCRKPRGIWDN
eukprot:6623920-Prymnesium_polylepis.1